MSSAISSNRAAGVGAVSLGGTGGKSGPAAAMSNVAANVASTITEQLRLAVDPDREHRRGSAQDLYEVEAAADELVEGLGGTASDKIRAAQALHGFAHEVASLVAARPGSRALEQVRQALERASASGQTIDVNAAVRMIEATTQDIAK